MMHINKTNNKVLQQAKANKNIKSPLWWTIGSVKVTISSKNMRRHFSFKNKWKDPLHQTPQNHPFTWHVLSNCHVFVIQLKGPIAPPLKRPLLAPFQKDPLHQHPESHPALLATFCASVQHHRKSTKSNIQSVAVQRFTRSIVAWLDWVWNSHCEYGGNLGLGKGGWGE